MSQVIDTSEWVEFRVGDLFEVFNGKKYVGKDRLPGDIPLISTSAFNQGISAYVSFPPGSDYKVDSNIITIAYSGSVGSTFYHPGSVFVGETVMGLKLRSKYGVLSNSVGLFMASILERKAKAFSYINKIKVKQVQDELTIQLPATSSGEPDWDYMAAYMDDVASEAEQALAKLESEASSQPEKIDISQWAEFKVGDLFEKLDLGFKPSRKFDKARDLSTNKTSEFDLPLVNAKLGNNGIMYYGRKSEWDYANMCIDIVADGAASTGSVYAQIEDTGVLYNAYLIKPIEQVSAPILLYLSAVLESSIKSKYGYDEKCTWGKVENDIILLPVTSTGEPDWDYMEDYMQELMGN